MTKKRRVGRPNTYNLELCREICQKVTSGGSIKTILKSSTRYPTFQTWCNWKREHVELFDLYIKAMQDKSETSIAEIYNTVSKMLAGEIGAKEARLIIDTHKWLAGKFYPKMYGPKSSIDVTTGGKELQQQITVFRLPDNGRMEGKEESNE